VTKEDLRAAAETARELVSAAAALVWDLQGKVAVRDKGGGQGPVTEADLRSEKILLAGLQLRFPGDAFVAEETRFDHIPAGRRIWCVDPLDGTREYADGLTEYAVMAGLLVDRDPVAGAVALPGEGVVYWGWRGGGAYADDTPLALETIDDLAEATAIHSRTHKNPGLAEGLDRLGVGRRRVAGSVGFKIGEVLGGRAHVYLHCGGGTKWWDSVAPAAILLAAGGTVTDAQGAPLSYADDLHHERGLLFLAPGLIGPVRRRLQADG